MTGVTTTNISSKALLADQVLVNRDGSTGLQSFEDHAKQLAGTGAIATALASLSSGVGTISKATRADLFADLAHDADGIAWVYGDTTVAYNGVYRKSGASGTGSWSRVLDLPYSFIRASNVGAGTPNAIQATTSQPVTGSALVLLSIAATNTGSPVTVQFNNEAARTIKGNSGADIAIGALRSGSVVIGVASSSSEFRLVVGDPVSPQIFDARDAAVAAATAAAADRAAAQTARTAAVNAQNAAAGYIDDMVTEKEVPIYATVIGMASVTVPAGMSVITVRGRFVVDDDDGGVYGLGNNGTPDKFTSADGRTWYKLRKNPIIVLVSGQSNAANVRTGYAWTPQTNVYVWNATGTAIGTAFVSPDNTQMSFPIAYANEIARQAPKRDVFVIVGARPGMPISGWMADRPLPEGVTDVYALTKSRIEAALAVLGATEITDFAWWQGESDAAAPGNYQAAFETVMARFQAESWFPLQTNALIMGVVPTAVNGSGIYSAMNVTLQKCAAADPQRRMFFYTGGAVPASDWQDELHLSGQGYFRAGQAAARKKLSGAGGYAGNGLWREPESGNFGIGPHSTAGQLLDVRRDADSASIVRVANLNAGDNADSAFAALSSNGTLDVRAYGAAQAGRAQVQWTGTVSLDVKAPNAAGGLRFFVGSSTENMRLSATGLNLLNGSLFVASQQVIKAPVTGWATPTGAVDRTNFVPASVTLATLAAQVNALKMDLHAGTAGHGLIRN